MPDVSIKFISDLIRDVEDGSLVLTPPFQRRLVWTNIVKDHFLETVILGLPFPEIFIATGEIDTKTMKRKNLLVDGQQRISTLREYVQGSADLVLTKVPPYVKLDEGKKTEFLGYRVVVRELGTVTEEKVKDIFARINSADYSLKAIERLNAKFSGAYKQFCDSLSKHSFFDRHNVFSYPDIKRMRDLDFCVILTTTLLSTYYHRDSLNKQYLQQYNDDFSQSSELTKQLETVFGFIEKCGFGKKCRVWKKTDLFTLLVELHSLMIVKKSPLERERVKEKLEDFYAQVDNLYATGGSDEQIEENSPDPNVFRYLKAATKATNDKYAREDRAEVIAAILQTTLDSPKLKSTERRGTKKKKK